MSRGKGRGRRQWEPRIRTNDRIRVREVRVVDAQGEQVGVMKVEDALKLAKRLVGNPSPPLLGTPCEFCGEFRGKKLTFEHNHDTMEFRGWSCDPCNRAFGILERSLGTSDLNVVAKRIKE